MGTPESVFAAAAKAGASDVHVAVGSPLMFRVDGAFFAQGEKAVTRAEAESFCETVLGSVKTKIWKDEREADTSYQIKDGTRLRVNCHFERDNPGMVARLIPEDVPTLAEIGFGEQVEELCLQRSGLILFTGPTGSGKSTSMAAMIEQIRTNRPAHVITLEDPIEFLFQPDGKGIIRQRQFGEDFHSFGEALKRVLRQDPDIIMVGEMRDLETVSAALTLAETGHLIFATLHTPNAVQSIDRIIDVFPPHQQSQVRTQLSLSLKAIIAQRLIPREGGGRIAQREILLKTPAVGNIIRDARLQELTSTMQTSVAEGMCTFERDAKRLYKEKLISKDVYEWAQQGA